MNLVNYDKLMQEKLEELREKNQKPKLLLHSCCAPCSTACIEKIKDYFDLCVYYYNPNLDSEQEFILRSSEQERYCKEINLPCIIEDYKKQEFLDAVKGLEDYKEGGKRCEKCFYLRLKKTAEMAKEKGFLYFATTLTVSPLKNAKMINEIGEEIAKECGINYLATDFKKREGYKRSIELSAEHNLYRQSYCGCEFSKNNQK